MIRTRALVPLMAIFCATEANAVQYEVIDLGPLPVGYVSDVAEGLNNAGDVAGYVSTAASASQAMSWSSGGGFDLLGTLGGDDSFAFAINDSGVAVGRSETGVGTQTRPFRIEPGGMMESLGTLGGNTGSANDINANGVITGTASTGSFSRAFLWTEGGGMMEIGGFAPGMSSTGNGINSAGHVAGSARNAADQERAFFWNGAGPLTPVGTIGTGTTSIATALNDSDTVVGFGGLEMFNSTFGAFVWTSGGGIEQLTELFTYETRAHDINNGGDIVGWSWINSMGVSRAVLWENAGPIVNLNDRIDAGSGWLLENATNINDAGQIVGVGKLHGQSRAFLLTPVPEPELVVIVGITMGLALLARRRP